MFTEIACIGIVIENAEIMFPKQITYLQIIR